MCFPRLSQRKFAAPITSQSVMSVGSNVASASNEEPAEVFREASAVAADGLYCAGDWNRSEPSRTVELAESQVFHRLQIDAIGVNYLAGGVVG